MFDPFTLTGFHTWLSILAILAGIPVSCYLLSGKVNRLLTAFFLSTAILTSATGFLFPFTGLLPSHIVGIVALVVLVVSLIALYGKKLHGWWSWIYAGSAVASVYLLVFVAIAQAFAKVPSLHELAPTPEAPVFGITQGIVFLFFAGFGLFAARAFKRRVTAA